MKKILFSLSILLTFTGTSFALAQAPDSPPGQEVAASHISACPHGNPHDTARCHAEVVTKANGSPKVTVIPAAYGPLQLRTAYNLLGSNGSASQIIAIV